MEDLNTSRRNQTISHREKKTPVRDLRVFGIGHGKFTALRLRALAQITTALEAELLSMESDVLVDDPGRVEDMSIDFYEAVEAFQRKLLIATLITERGHQSRAAQRLSINTTTLNSMLKRYGIDARTYRTGVLT